MRETRLHAAVWLVLEKDDQYFFIRRYNTGYFDGHYTFVCGHVEDNEGATAAMIREAKEEAGITLRAEHLTVRHIQHRNCPDREYLDIFFTASAWEGEPQNMEADKCDDVRWFPKDDLPENIIPHLGEIVQAIDNNQSYSELGW